MTALPDTTTTNTKTETLSRSELFTRYLDAPVRVGATSSTLIADPGKEVGATARACLL